MPEQVNGISPGTQLVYSPARSILGRSNTFNMETRDQIAHMWSRFAGEAGELLAKRQSFGVSYGFAGESFQYLCGFDQADDLPAEWDSVEIPEGRYLVLTYTGHVSGIPAAYGSIWSKLLPEANIQHDPRPVIEVYDERFDGRTQSGVVEFWIPVAG